MQHYHPYTFFPLGDAAVLIQLGDGMDAPTNQRVHRLFRQLQAAGLPFVTDVVPAYSSLALYYDLAAVYPHRLPGKTAYETVVALLETLPFEPDESPGTGRRHRVPVCYAPPFAPDLANVAALKGLTAEQVVREHTGHIYTVYFVGFLPGFAYLGELPESIRVPRRQEPRREVPAGSVALAGAQTGIYPLPSPGGWQLIGRTPLSLFQKSAPQPVWLQPGDEVEFYSITEDEFNHTQSRLV